MIIALLASIALYQSLDPTSIAQHFAFYELYPETKEGKKALEDGWKLLSPKLASELPMALPSTEAINSFISLIQPIEHGNKYDISEAALLCIEKAAASLSNRSLKGFGAKSLAEISNLAPEEIDLTRALLLAQFGDTEKVHQTIRQHEAALDLMALQIRIRLSPNATVQDKIRAINHLIFYEMGFRFPPHSSYSNQIDLFTFLPSVLESRRGVCLGVSMVYLCLAQRLDLNLEIITPPGHIYLRAHDGDKEINIETTLRGVHVPSHEYLGINNRYLPTRSIKEVIGMGHFNQASLWLAQSNWQKAAECYATAIQFMPDDVQALTLYGCSLLLCNQDKSAHALLQKASQLTHSCPAISPDPLVADILNNVVDKEALQSLFLYVDNTHASLLKKQQALEEACKRSPKFRSGLFQLAVCWLQLHKPAKALALLEKYHALDPTDISVEFYLATLYFSRFAAPQAKRHYEQAEMIAQKKNYLPVALKQFAVVLGKKCV